MRHQSTICSKWAPLLLYFVVALSCIATAFITVLRYSTNTLNTTYLLLPSLLAIASVYLFVRLVKKWKNEPFMMFLLIAMPAAYSFCLFIPPGFVPDEYVHICRMFSLSTSGVGDMVIPSAFADAAFPSTYGGLSNVLTTSYNWSDTFIEKRDMSSYFPHMYLLPGICSELLEALNVNPFIAIYICRGVNAALFLTAGYWVVKLLPLGQTIMFVYLLNPMLIQQEASCSADAFVNIVCLLFIAVVLNARFTKGKLSKMQIGGIVILSLLLPCSKYVYAPLLLMLFMLLPRLKNKKARIGISVGFVALAILAVIVVVTFYHSDSTLGYTVDLVRDPLLCITVVGKTLYTLSLDYMESFAGHMLGPLFVKVCGVFYVLFFCLLTASLFTSIGEKVQLNRYEKILLWGIAIVVLFLVMVSMRKWSIEYEMRSDILIGVQGRYFIPVAILPFLAAINPKKHITRSNALIGFGGVMACSLFASVAAICIFFM